MVEKGPVGRKSRRVVSHGACCGVVVLRHLRREREEGSCVCCWQSLKRTFFWTGIRTDESQEERGDIQGRGN